MKEVDEVFAVPEGKGQTRKQTVDFNAITSTGNDVHDRRYQKHVMGD